VGNINIQRGSGGSAGSNALLDGTNHTDTVAQAVSRGSLIYGDSTPKWNELVLGGARKAVMSDGTDALWRYPGLVFLASATASASATVDFTLTGWTNADFMGYMIAISHLLPATDNTILWLRTSTDGGSTFEASAGNYQWSTMSDATNHNSAADTEIQMTGTGQVGGAANEGLSGKIWTSKLSEAKFASFHWHLSKVFTDGTMINVTGAGQRESAADVDAIRFLMSSGNITSGEFRLYGIPND
jgi:hypothetical protein